jgi:hypothetical protein
MRAQVHVSTIDGLVTGCEQERREHFLRFILTELLEEQEKLIWFKKSSATFSSRRVRDLLGLPSAVKEK